MCCSSWTQYVVLHGFVFKEVSLLKRDNESFLSISALNESRTHASISNGWICDGTNWPIELVRSPNDFWILVVHKTKKTCSYTMPKMNNTSHRTIHVDDFEPIRVRVLPNPILLHQD